MKADAFSSTWQEPQPDARDDAISERAHDLFLEALDGWPLSEIHASANPEERSRLEGRVRHLCRARAEAEIDAEIEAAWDRANYEDNDDE